MSTALRLTVIVTLAGCAAGAEPAPKPAALPQGVLGAGDIFEVRVYGEPDLSGSYRVGPDGNIDMPLAGRINVLKLTTNDATDRIRDELSRFLKAPQVSLLVKEYSSQKVHVFGEVRTPGTFAYQEGMSIVEAITLAGGFSTLAAKNRTYVTRLIDGREQKLSVGVEDIGEGDAPNFALEPGDIVYVPEVYF